MMHCQHQVTRTLLLLAEKKNNLTCLSLLVEVTEECSGETCEIPPLEPPALESEDEAVPVPDEFTEPVPDEITAPVPDEITEPVSDEVTEPIPDEIIEPVPEDTFPFTIVTAASSNHFCALESMLYTFRELKKYVAPKEFPRLVVYSLGIDSNQQSIVNNMLEKEYFDEFIEFNYDAYPPFWNVQIERGQYAWKPGIVKEAQKKYGGVIVWLDTGDVPNALFIKMIPEYIRRHGFWSPRSTGLIGSKFNHIGMFNYFKLRRKDFEMYENCNGAAVGFDASNQTIVNELIDPWYECALEQKCIAPPSSSRQNHRQDQSAITLLATRAGYRCFEYPEFHGLTIHQDEFCHQRLMVLEENGLLLHPSSIGNV